MADQQQLRDLERSSYYAVVRALYACARLETFESELLLTDLQVALNIEPKEHLDYLHRVERDAEAIQLARFTDSGHAEAPAPSRALAAIEAPRPAVQAPPAIVVPQWESPFRPGSGGPASKSKGKKAMAPPASGGVAKQAGIKRVKSGASTPSTPRSSHAKGAAKGGLDKRLVGAAAASHEVSQHKALERAQAELDRLNTREREIFETLVSMGVAEDDPDLNEVHRSLLRWYRLDMRQRQIEQELGRLVAV